jgi:hypothetical protein
MCSDAKPKREGIRPENERRKRLRGETWLKNVLTCVAFQCRIRRPGDYILKCNKKSKQHVANYLLCGVSKMAQQSHEWGIPFFTSDFDFCQERYRALWRTLFVRNSLTAHARLLSF